MTPRRVSRKAARAAAGDSDRFLSTRLAFEVKGGTPYHKIQRPKAVKEKMPSDQEPIVLDPESKEKARETFRSLFSNRS